MLKRLPSLAVGIVIVLMIAGALYAQRTATTTNEVDRCTTTCSMLVDHYNKNYAAMKAHEGDKQCWQTCWSRAGTRESGSAAEMKSLWMDKKETSMRVNQCAQACWRKHNDNSNTVDVGGWRSTPRTAVCSP